MTNRVGSQEHLDAQAELNRAMRRHMELLRNPSDVVVVRELVANESLDEWYLAKPPRPSITRLAWLEWQQAEAERELHDQVQRAIEDIRRTPRWRLRLRAFFRSLFPLEKTMADANVTDIPSKKTVRQLAEEAVAAENREKALKGMKALIARREAARVALANVEREIEDYERAIEDGNA